MMSSQDEEEAAPVVTSNLQRQSNVLVAARSEEGVTNEAKDDDAENDTNHKADGGAFNKRKRQEEEGGEGESSNNNTTSSSIGGSIQQQCTYDPSTMQLSQQELEWAMETKQAFEEDDDILAKSFSDFEIATYAIVDQGDIDRSVERAQCMQAFRMMYNINNTAKEGIEIFTRQNEICPNMFLSLEQCDNTDGFGSHALFVGLANYYPARFLDDGVDPKAFRANIGSMYYHVLCMQPDLKSVRDGFRQIIEMDGAGWQNVSFKVEMRSVDELLGHMPYRRRQVKCLRVPSIALVILSMLKPFLSEHKAFVFGTQELQQEFPEPIKDCYLQPTPEQAFGVLMKRCEGFLQRRFANEAAFRLATATREVASM